MLRRDLLTALAVLPSARRPAFAAAGMPQQTDQPTDLVDPFIGTGGDGHCYPGAQVPFGMVSLSPDTGDYDWSRCAGYVASDDTILGFSHTHLSGTGVADMLDCLVSPCVGPVVLRPGSPDAPDGSYRKRFRHEDEEAAPGFYRVLFRDQGIEAELTATARAGMHRYTFPADGPAHLLIDWAHAARAEKDGKTEIADAELRVLDDGTLVGRRRVTRWARHRMVCFALRVQRPGTAIALYSDDLPAAEGARDVSGTHLKAVLDLGGRRAGPVLVKVGLSAVSVEGAIGNLDAEMPDWDFDRVRADARAAWADVLGRIDVETDVAPDRTYLFTALYHAAVAPLAYDDVDGRYRAMDATVRQLAPGERNFTALSLWDTYRAWSPLMSLWQPERLPSLLNTLIRMAEESPAGVPVWPLGGDETGTMNGCHGASMLAEARAKGVGGVDYARAYAPYRRRLMQDDRDGWAAYRAHGYVTCDTDRESVSRTGEYAFDDWAVSHLANAAGQSDDARMLRERSRNYRNVYDIGTGFVRPRRADGGFASPFTPYDVHSRSLAWRDFTEANAWQTNFIVQHDIPGLIAMHGGAAAFEAKLDQLFSTASFLPDADTPPDLAGMIGQYVHGNEPCHHIAYLYAYVGAPHKTQALVRRILRTMHTVGRDAMAGNDDCGQMSAWFVLSSLGFYPVDPVSAVYVFGSPLFRRATLTLAGGRRLTIAAPGNGVANYYVQSVTWNGAPYPRCWISHAELAQGGTLVFRMGHQASDFGSQPEHRPPAPAGLYD